MISSQALFEMSQVDITNINPKSLIHVDTVTVSGKLTHEQKILSVIEQTGNPYCFLSGDTPVRICFSDKGKPLSEALINYFSQLKQK